MITPDTIPAKHREVIRTNHFNARLNALKHKIKSLNDRRAQRVEQKRLRLQKKSPTAAEAVYTDIDGDSFGNQQQKTASEGRGRRPGERNPKGVRYVREHVWRAVPIELPTNNFRGLCRPCLHPLAEISKCIVCGAIRCDRVLNIQLNTAPMGPICPGRNGYESSVRCRHN